MKSSVRDIGLRRQRAGRVVVVGAVAVGSVVDIQHIALVIRLAADIGQANSGDSVDLLLHGSIPGLGKGGFEAPGERGP